MLCLLDDPHTTHPHPHPLLTTPCRQTQVLNLLDEPGALSLWQGARAPPAARDYFGLQVFRV